MNSLPEKTLSWVIAFIFAAVTGALIFSAVERPNADNESKRKQNLLRDGPLEKLWGGEGNFRPAGIFFRYQIPCMNFFQALA